MNDSFESKKYYQKILITLGSPFNFLLALFILFVINLYGVNKVTPIIGT